MKTRHSKTLLLGPTNLVFQLYAEYKMNIVNWNSVKSARKADKDKHNKLAINHCSTLEPFSWQKSQFFLSCLLRRPLPLLCCVYQVGGAWTTTPDITPMFCFTNPKKSTLCQRSLWHGLFLSNFCSISSSFLIHSWSWRWSKSSQAPWAAQQQLRSSKAGAPGHWRDQRSLKRNNILERIKVLSKITSNNYSYIQDVHIVRTDNIFFVNGDV